MSSSNYPTVNYDVFIPSDWSSTSGGGGFTEAQLNTKYLRFPIAQTTQEEVLNNVTLSGQITTGNSNPMVIPSASRNMSITSDPLISFGTDNTGFGNNNILGLGSGNYNSAFGSQALAGVRTTSSNNTGIGYNAGLLITTGSGNTCIGSSAGSTNITTGNNNTLLGYNTSANGNYTKSTAIGNGAVITASNQFVLGTSTETVIVPSGIIQNTRTTNNTLIGSKSTYTIGDFNTCLGSGTLNTTGSTDMVGNTCVGYNSGLALLATTTNQASNNALVGRSAGSNITTGSSNVCIGQNSGQNIISGSVNVCIGQGAGGSNATSGNSNTFLGGNTTSTVNVGSSTVIGYNAQATASNQIVLGTSSETVIVPSGVITSSSGNLYFGSVKPPTLGNLNLGLGIGVFQSGNTSTANSVGIGYGSLNTCQSTSNTAVGYYALPTLTSGSNNTAIGKEAGGINGGIGVITGSNNTFVGANATVASGGSAFSNSTAIGSGSTITASNQVVLGTSSESVVIPARRTIGLASALGTGTSVTYTTLTGTTLTTINTPNIPTNYALMGSGIPAGTYVVSGTGNSYTVSPNVGVMPAGTLFYLPTTTFSIASITGTSMITTTTQLNFLTVGMILYGPNITSGSTITAVISATSFTLSVAGINTATAVNGYYLSNSICINSISPLATTSTMLLASAVTLSLGTYIAGAGINVGTNIVGVNSPTSYIISGVQTLAPTSYKYSANYVIPVALSFPFNEIYYINPNYTNNIPIIFQFPYPITTNISAKTCFRLVSTNTSTTNSYVMLLFSNPNLDGIYTSTTSTGVGQHTIYSSGASTIPSHTFYCLPTPLNQTGYGFFQQGAV